MFYYLTYEGAVALDDIPDAQQRKARAARPPPPPRYWCMRDMLRAHDKCAKPCMLLVRMAYLPGQAVSISLQCYPTVHAAASLHAHNPALHGSLPVRAVVPAASHLSVAAQAVEDQIRHFGQTPAQLYRRRHPRRGPAPPPAVAPLLNGPDAFRLTVVGRPPPDRCVCASPYRSVEVDTHAEVLGGVACYFRQERIMHVSTYHTGQPWHSPCLRQRRPPGCCSSVGRTCSGLPFASHAPI